MASIDILNIESTVISRGLNGKYVLLYGKPKSGKTTAACAFPKVLLCAFEKGYNLIGGIKPQDITKWTDFRQVLKQLENPKARAMYDTIVIDTVSIAWDCVEQFVCQQNGVQKIGDIPWGGGYAAARKEFDTSLRKITQLGYGVVLIAHSASHFEKTADGSEVEIIAPELPKRAAEVCNGIVDIIGYIGNEFTSDGEHKRWLYTRETPTLFAGSRFKYLAPKIPFGYNELVNAINAAIDKQEEVDGIRVVNTIEKTETDKALDFNAVRAEASELWSALVTKDPEYKTAILKKIELTMGHKMKLSEFTEDQVDLLNLVVLEMREMV